MTAAAVAEGQLDGALRLYRRRRAETGRLDAPSGLDLSTEVRRVLELAADVEALSARYAATAVRVAGRGHPEVAAFLGEWAEDEAGHSAALRTAAGLDGGTGDSSDRLLGHLLAALMRTTCPRAYLATYAAVGAVGEHSVIATYRLIGKYAGSAELAVLLEAICHQESLHFQFYRAAYRDLRSASGCAAVRSYFRHLHTPVGYRSLGQARWDEMFGFCVRDRADARRLLGVDAYARREYGLRRLAGWEQVIAARRPDLLAAST